MPPTVASANPGGMGEPLQRLGLWRLATYPLELPAVGVVVVLALARIPVAYAPFVGPLLHFLLWLAIYKFAFEMLVNSARGWLRAPEGNAHVDGGQASHHLMLQGLLILLNVAAFRLLGWPGACLAALFTGLVQPGATIALAIDHGIFHALSPRRWLEGTRLGPGYPVLVLLYGAIALLQSAAGAILTWPFGSILALFAYYLFANYLVAVSFHATGYALYRRHGIFGFEINPPMARPDPHADPEQALLDQVERQLQRGETEAAFALLKSSIAQHKSIGVYEKYHEMLRERGDNAAILAHAAERIGMLLARNETRRALAAANEALGLDPAFTPSDGADVLRLVQKAEELGQQRMAVALAEAYRHAFPKRADALQLGLLAARMLAEPLADRAAALGILTELEQSPAYGTIAAEAMHLRARWSVAAKSVNP